MSVRNWLGRKTGRDLEWPTVLLVALVGVLLVTLFVAVSTSGAAFGLFNPSWDGTSEFRGAIEDDPDTELLLLEEAVDYPTDTANESVAFIIAPDEEYDDESIDAIETFLDHGGTLIVLDNRETVNPLLSAIGSDARIEAGVVLDDRHYDNGPAMPVVSPTGEHGYTSDVDRLTLNHAAVVESETATPIVSTSDYAYLAASPSAELDSDSNLTSYPVATVESVSDGEVVVVSDPSIAINAMYETSDNSEFVSNLYTDREYVLLDSSHTGMVPPLIAVRETVRHSPLAHGSLGLFTVVTIAIASSARARGIRAVSRRYLSSRRDDSRPETRERSDEELAATLRNRHPELNDERAHKLIAAFNRSRSKDGDE
ncbi:DUF4350 domain-containing protein [Natrialba swarupiae]|uniref:DUF4350 domain-containing protein n=1 Tax=Natrialba swarupiae TaxID=2448032 RepID=A0A5D5AH75_9EURY|nr:DUF4350 domain-containing protein [Natrialba swarupiae]TYT60484.1 DUF4350 domain-containing protein [Natrialba swarupiae]